MQLRTISATIQVAALNQNFLTNVFIVWVSVGRSIDTAGAVLGALGGLRCSLQEGEFEFLESRACKSEN